jgi:hypothetical protein
MDEKINQNKGRVRQVRPGQAYLNSNRRRSQQFRSQEVGGEGVRGGGNGGKKIIPSIASI